MAFSLIGFRTRGLALPKFLFIHQNDTRLKSRKMSTVAAGTADALTLKLPDYTARKA